MSKELFVLASRLAAWGIAVERMPRGRRRGIRLYRRSVCSRLFLPI